uniref:Uncharacterized protein n=1 Tax=Sphaeramia orbicularis TaxID=375764 RepID=A0A673AAS9_9TELE
MKTTARNSEEALQDEEGKGDESKITTEAEEKDTDQLRVPEAEENFSSGEPSIQISPRTVTVQAEVHVVSPKEEPVKAVGKVASIFTRRKGASSPQTETGHQLSPSSLNAKRKSNVVLQEGDLELAVLESESTPKCSEVERKQFMAAFKQPSLDGSKTKPVKSQGKQKQAGEKTVDTTEKANEDDVTVLPSSEKITASSQENKVAKKKPARKGRKMAKEEKEEATTLPAAAPEEGTVVIVEEVDKKDLPITSTPSMPAVRRSTREAVVRQTSKPEPKTPTRRQDRSKDAAPLTQDSTLEISTSKRHKSRHGVFKAEMTKDSKKAKQAKKLVEKAKAIQQSKKTSVTEKRTLRRSSRTEASLKKSYCENESLVEDAVCWRLLTASKQRGVDLIYSNMEKLLPLPLTQLTISVHKPEQFVPDSQDQPSVHPQEPQSDKLPSHGRLLNTGDSDCSDDASPVKVSNRMRKSKKRHRLFDQDKLQSDSDSEDGFLSLCQQKGLPHVPEKVKESLVSEKVKRKPLTPQEQVKSVPISQCLQSIADFLDDMSYMDSSLLHSEGDDIHRGMIPTGAMVKDGLSDESRVESSRGNWMTGECVLEIQAAVEALSFSKCRLAVTDTWEKVQQLDEELRKDSAAEMSLPMAPHREGYSFTQDSPCQPQVVQRRMEVMEDLMLKGVFGTVGNRPAAALDYLPALRTICRSEQLKEQGKVKRR